MSDTIWFSLALIAVIVACELITNRKARRLKAKQNNKPVDLQGVKVGRQKVRCPVELCDYREGEYCTNQEIDLCMLVKNNYDQYGLYCRCFKSDSVVDAKG